MISHRHRSLVVRLQLPVECDSTMRNSLPFETSYQPGRRAARLAGVAE
jgi:hypothetical protein